MVRWEDAIAGMTHGLPGFDTTEWETFPPNDEGWVAVKVPREDLLELVRTPSYSTIHGERWLFWSKANDVRRSLVARSP